nr:LysM peptidoglycan-binding domain-containing protein [Thermoflexales bacterium]
MNIRLNSIGRALCGLAVAATAVFAAAPSTASAADATAPEAYSCYYYRVVRGDTLGRLAIRYGTTVNAIMSANGLRNTVIYVGRVLCIPQAYTPPSGGAWLAQFWNNTTQSGAPVYSRYDAALNFQWGFGTPNPSAVVGDFFSGRWTRTYNFVGGTYRFSLNADDGIAMWVDNTLVFDRLSYEGYQANVVDIPIGPGLHTIRVDYVELTGLAKVSASFYRVADGGYPPPNPPPYPPPYPPPSSVSWNAQFFNNTTLAGAPVLAVSLGALDFNWGSGSISAQVQPDNFTARFTSVSNFAGGNYRFYAQSDDGVRMFLDGVPI